MSGDGRRPRRVADAIRAHLAGELQGKAGDPMLAVCVITAVDVTDDLGVAKIGVRLLADSGDPKPRKELLRRFEAALPKLRRSVGAALAIRRVPELRFFYDEGHDHARRVDELLHEIEREKAQKPS